MRAVESPTDSSLSCNLTDEEKKKKSPHSSSDEEDVNSGKKLRKRTKTKKQFDNPEAN